MSEIRKQKNKYQEELTWAPPLCGPASWLAQPAAGPAHLPPLSSSSRQREGSVAGARARHRATPPLSLPACPPLLASMPLDDATPPPCSLSLSPGSSLLSLALSLTRPNTTLAAVRHSSRLQPPLAPLASLCCS